MPGEQYSDSFSRITKSTPALGNAYKASYESLPEVQPGYQEHPPSQQALANSDTLSYNQTPMVEETHPVFNMQIQENNPSHITPFAAFLGAVD